MSLQLIVGPSGSGKTGVMYDMLLERAGMYPDRNFIVLVPEQFNMQAQKDIVERSPVRGIMNIDVLSFQRLCHRIFDEAGRSGGVILNDTGKTMVLRRVAAGCEASFKTMGGRMDKAGYINEVKSLISEFMQYDISPSDVEEMTDGSRTGNAALGDKLSDLGLLYRSFNEYLGSKFITAEEITDRALEVSDGAAFLSDAELYLDGFTGFTPVQLRFLSDMLSRCKRVVVTLDMGLELLGKNGSAYLKPRDETELFALSRTMAHELYSIARKGGVDIEDSLELSGDVPYRLRDFPSLAFMEKYIFRSTLPRDGERVNVSGISLLRCTGLKEEADGVCRRICSLVREKGCRYSDIAILTGDLEQYHDVLKSEMKRYDIPAFFDLRRHVTLNPLTELIESVVEMTLRDYSYESVFRYIKSSLSPIDRASAVRMETYVLSAGIRRKRDYTRPWTRVPQQFTPEDLEELNGLRLAFIRSLSPTEGVFYPKKKVKCSLLVNALYGLLKDLGVYHALMDRALLLKEKGDIPGYDEFRQIYGALMDLFDSMMEFLPDEELSLKDFGDILKAGLSELSVGILPPGTDEVQVGDIGRSRLSQVEYLFLVGVNDGLIPADERRGGLLSELDRRALKEQGVTLAPGIREQAFLQRFYLYMYLTKARKGLCLSYSLRTPGGEAIAPSYLIDEIKRLFPDLSEEGAMDGGGLLTAGEALEALSEGIGRRGRIGRDDIPGLFAYFAGEKEYAPLLKAMLSHGFRQYEGDRIHESVAAALYALPIRGSITRLEKYARCAYAHFLDYGLRLLENREFSFDTRDLGTIYHEVLRRFGERVCRGGYDWMKLTDSDTEQLTGEALDEVLGSMKDSSLYDTARSAYMDGRIRRVMNRVIPNLVYQIRKGDFVPEHFEYAFDNGVIRGVIDRLDVYRSGEDTYLRVIDYKSGNNRFDLASLYEGVALQLAVYAREAQKLEQKRSGGRDAVNAGMLYYRICDPVTEFSDDREPDDEELSAKVRKELMPRGVLMGDGDILRHMDRDLDSGSDVIRAAIRKDGGFDQRSEVMKSEDLKEVVKYSETKTDELLSGMTSGVMDARPYRDDPDSRGACEWCRYRDICGFDEYVSGYSYRDKTELEDEDIMKMIIRENEEWNSHRSSRG